MRAHALWQPRDLGEVFLVARLERLLVHVERPGWFGHGSEGPNYAFDMLLREDALAVAVFRLAAQKLVMTAYALKEV